MAKQTSWIGAVCTVLTVLALSLRTSAAHADTTAVYLHMPLAPEQTFTSARAERTSGIVLSLAGLGLAVVGGSIGGTAHDDRNWRTGVGIGTLGGIVFVPGIITAAYGFGRMSGLQLFSQHDEEETTARRQQIGGGVMFFSGLVLSLAGGLMALNSLPAIQFEPSATPNRGKDAMLQGGIALSVIGDVMWVTGMVLWPYGAGRVRGIRESRQALQLSPTGISGTF